MDTVAVREGMGAGSAIGAVLGVKVAVFPMFALTGDSVRASSGQVVGNIADRARVSSSGSVAIAVSTEQRGQRAFLPAFSPVTRSVQPQPEQAKSIMGMLLTGRLSLTWTLVRNPGS